ncbi:hypothetical protein E3T24_14890 [Cryobacterium sp. TmT2-59]|uniref:hypothetical protein n=1 Tax=Cryobacterium sp. TmT2-59 TaxID=1259264 RepID=UPI001069C58E|nr:hypothetical protein [Cryobacterium sp. TmT2-59]TFC81627.1 hypothetical protein E3T24_14890 [Cryobacterium sp. TmT2-59]
MSCTVLFLFWHAVSGLRVASVSGFAAAALGLGLLAAGLAACQDDASRLFVGLLGAAVGAFLHPLTLPRRATGLAAGDIPAPSASAAHAPDPTPHPAPAAPVPHRFWPSVDRVPERVSVLVPGGLALIGAALTATIVDPAFTLSPLITLGAVTVAAVLHQMLIVRRASPGSADAVFAYGCAALAALTLTTIAPLMAYRADNVTAAITVPILVAVLIPLAVEPYARRRSAGPARTAAIVGGGTAALVAAGFAVLVITAAAIPLLVALTSGLAGTGTGTMLAPIRPDSVWALGTLAAVGLLATLAWLIGGIPTERRRVLAALFLGIAVLAVPFSGSLLAVTLLYALLGSLSLAALVPARRGWMSLGVFRPVALAFFVLTETFGYLASWQSSTIWWIGSLAAITALLGARLLVDRTGDVARGLLLAGAIALTLVAAIAAPWMLTLGGAPSVTAVFVDCLRALTLTTALLQLFVALPLPRLFTVADRRWAFWTLLAPTVLAFALPVTVLAESLSAAERAALLQGAPAAGIAHATVLLAALLFWLLLPANRDILARERLVAAIGVAPVLWLLLWSVARIPPATPEDRVLVVPAAALVACGLGLTLGLLRGRSRDRLALEAGAALVLVPGTIWALATAQPLGWLMLLLAGIAALLSAIAADGLFGSRSHRRHLGWLALALGTSGLWLGLARAGTTDVEPYVLPVAGVLLLLAALLHRFGRIDRIDRATTAGSGAALLAFAGLLVAIVPLALAAGSGSLLRAVLVAAASAVLLLGAGSIRWTPPRSAYLAAAAAGGAIGLALTSVVQAGAVLGESGAPAARLEYWLLPLAALIAGAFLLAAQTDAASRRLRRLAGVALVLLALSLGTLAEISAFGRVGEGGGSLDAVVAGLRASSVVIILSALHVRVVWRPRAPLTAAVGTAAIALAGLAMASAVVTGATDPFELVTVPVGLALVLGRLLPAAGENTGQDAGQNPAENPGTGAAPSVVSRRPVSVGVALGLGLAVLPSAFAGGTSTGAELLRPVLVLALSGALAVSGALLTRRPRWSAAAWPALVVGLLGVLITAGARILDLLAQVPLGPDARLEAWLLPAALLVVAAGTSLVAGIRRAAAVSGGHQATDPAGLRLGYGLVVLAIVGILAAEALALGFARRWRPCG